MPIPHIVVLAAHLLFPTPMPIDFSLMTPNTALAQPAPGDSTAAEPYTRDTSPGPAARRGRGITVSGAPAIQGYGTDIPLSFAVRQIVPPGFKVVFDPGVQHDRTVSWVGGKPWRTVLQDALRPLGLRLEVTGQTARLLQR